MGIDPDRRAEAQAAALAELIDFLAEHDLDDRVAFTEIHNEVQVGHSSPTACPASRKSASWRCGRGWSGHLSCSTGVTPSGR